MRRKVNNNHVMLFIIFIVLLISNIVLYAALLMYYSQHYLFLFNWANFNYLLSMISAIIILGFISTRLHQFRNLGDSSIYEIGYLIILGILSITISTFNESTHSKNIVLPFLEMFKILSVFLIFMILASKTKPFQHIMHNEASKKDLVFTCIIFSIMGCLASLYVIPVDSSLANVRNLVVIIASLFAGPYVGIPAGIVAGIFRFSLGGPTALPCALATMIAGVVGTVVYIYSGRKFPRGFPAVILMFLYIGFEMLLIVLMTPENISIDYVTDIYPLMVFAAVVGMALFKMIIKEVKSDASKVSYEQLRINELENTLVEYKDQLDQLQEDMESLKEDSDLK